MTTATTEPAAGAKAHPRPGFGRLLLAEWTKIRTVRSTLWSLILLVILDLGFTALFVGLTVAQWDDMQPGDRAQVTADPVSMILGSGFFLSQLTVCVLGVLVIASEYSTGMIRASLLAVPRRLPMLWAKALVFSLVVLVLGIAVSFVSFFIGAAFLGSKVEVSLGDEGVLRAVIGGGLYLAMLGLFALAIGAIVRHSAGRHHRRDRLRPRAGAARGAAPRQHRRARPRLPALRGRHPDRQGPPGPRRPAHPLAGLRRVHPVDRRAARPRRVPPQTPRRLTPAGPSPRDPPAGTAPPTLISAPRVLPGGFSSA
ncbi:ABC transporter permease [Actinomadura madurae]|uniref:ABC transporter permease n=1 Tax=Actinomadura madurae TaxID=1993 RepID=UPI0020D20205|nr:ABC transporter permease [Actinomadura madurae]MCP9964581.1 ABC transporter permease [Actinomadura madurae]